MVIKYIKQGVIHIEEVIHAYHDKSSNCARFESAIAYIVAEGVSEDLWLVFVDELLANNTLSIPNSVGEPIIIKKKKKNTNQSI